MKINSILMYIYTTDERNFDNWYATSKSIAYIKASCKNKQNSH